ncbi:MAG: patatin-like phospholipase family protein, partial [Acidiferrobacter sp.]
MATEPKLALVMSGGGAHAAYQVGVLRAIVRILPRHAQNPFSIYCGTSAGAINCTALAAHAGNLRHGVQRLTRIWGRFQVEEVFTADWGSLMATAARWLLALAFGRFGRPLPLALLDRAPLEDLLAEHLLLDSIAAGIDAGVLHAVSVTASSYATGQSVTFFEGVPGLRPWRRADRLGVPAKLTIAHLLASSAIPFVFEPVPLGGDYFGDGSMRQTAPLSAALHLGAERLFVIGAQSPVLPAAPPEGPPSVAHMAGHVLDSIFLEGLDADLERLERINQTVRALARRGSEAPAGLSEVACFVIHPSQSLDAIANLYHEALPRPLRFFLGALAGRGRPDSALLSYLLFERSYCRHLMALGYSDAMRNEANIRAFLGYADDAARDYRLSG